MSIRTIMEINHDHLADLQNPAIRSRLEHDLARLGEPELIERSKRGDYGHIRILGQRHHSSPEWIQASNPRPAGAER